MIIATVGGTTSNSYVTAAEAQAYFAGRVGGEAWDLVDDVEGALITATAEIDKETFYGAKTATTQALKFPRTGMTDDQLDAYADNIIPPCVKQATFELALFFAQTPDALVSSSSDLSEFKSLTLGNNEVAIQPAVGVTVSAALPDRVRALLSSVRINPRAWVT